MTTEADVGLLKDAAPLSPTPDGISNQDDVFDVVGLEDVKKFVERKHLQIDPFEYPRNGSEPGLVLIFNQETFISETASERKGSKRDVNELVVCLQRLGFNIEKDNIMHNSTTDSIKKKLKEVSETDLKEQNSLIIFSLTHGDTDDELLTRDSISTYDIWQNFIECEDLANKPKMFVFQACKGHDFSTTKKKEHPKERTEIVKYTTIGPDMLVVYSTIEGNESYRSSRTGSWFIQELCKNFNAYGKRDDVISLITRTAKCVSGNYYFFNRYGFHRKQMPVYMSTLSKKFYLNRNKDRTMVLMYKSYYEDILGEILEIKKRVSLL